MYRDEKNPEAGHKLGEKSFPTEGIYVHEYNTKRKSNCFHKPRGKVKIAEVYKAAVVSADTSALSHPTRRAFWAKAFELLKSIDNSAEGKDRLHKLYQEYSNPLSISETHDTSDEEDDNYFEDDSQNSTEIKITQIDLQQNRPDDELPFSLQEASKLCEVEPTNTDKQEAATLALLVKTADSTGEILPFPFQFPHFGLKGYEAAKKLCETSSTLFSRSTQFSFQLDEFNSTLQQLKDSYDRRVSKPANVLFKEKNLWHALQMVKTSITLNEGKTKKVSAEVMLLNEKQTLLSSQEDQLKGLTDRVAKAEARATSLEKELAFKTSEIQEMYEGFNSVQDTFITQMNRLDSRINELATPSMDKPQQTLSPDRNNETAINRMDAFESSLSSLEASLVTLREAQTAAGTPHPIQLNGVEGVTYESFNTLSEVVAGQGSRITSIEAFNKEGVVERSIHVGDKFYHTHDDLMVDVQASGVPIEIGFVSDIIMVLEGCHEASSNKFDQLEDMKLQTLSNSLGMSVATSTAIHCGTLKFPSIFCGKSKIGVSAFGSIKFDNWRGKRIIRSGIAHQIETAVPNIRAKYLSAIGMYYKRSVPAENQWRLISEGCLKTSCTFIRDLINYIDEMMRTLTQGAGNDEEEAWSVVMAAVGKLFEEYFSPVRGLPISDIPKADTDSLSARRFFAKALWSNLQMSELTKELTNSNSGIKNHPIIASAYTEWGLLNSGKPMAAKAIKMADKAVIEVKEVSNSLSKLHKLVNEVQQTAKNAKNVADRLSTRLDKAGTAK